MIFGYHLNLALIYLILLHSRMKESLSFLTTDSSNYMMPYFEFDVQRNVTVTVGQTAFLHCRVERLGDKDVSWIRKRDLHILTAGASSYTSDQRFQVIKSNDAGNWTLQIKYPQLRDSGVYECQINTEPKMSFSYTLNVLELKARILGPSDLYVKSGSQIILTCRLAQGPHDLGTVFWYKGNNIIETVLHENDVLSDDHRISVDTDWREGLTSRLRIQRALQSDSGNYTCVPTIAKSSSIFVNVITGEHPAAMQHNAAHRPTSNYVLAIFVALLVQLIGQHSISTRQHNSIR